MQVLKIGNCKKINLKGIENFQYIKKLYFRRVKLQHSLEILKLQNLKYINLAESKYSNKLEEKLKKGIQIDKTLM